MRVFTMLDIFIRKETMLRYGVRNYSLLMIVVNLFSLDRADGPVPRALCWLDYCYM